jgi:hypothetical protein
LTALAERKIAFFLSHRGAAGSRDDFESFSLVSGIFVCISFLYIRIYVSFFVQNTASSDEEYTLRHRVSRANLSRMAHLLVHELFSPPSKSALMGTYHALFTLTQATKFPPQVSVRPFNKLTAHGGSQVRNPWTIPGLGESDAMASLFILFVAYRDEFSLLGTYCVFRV